MDGEAFDALVKRLTQTRVTRVEALRGLVASAAAGLTGASLPDNTAAKTKGKQGKKQAKGKAQAKGKGKGKHKKNSAHRQAKPVCPGGRCDNRATDYCGTACTCVGRGGQSRCVLTTTTTAAVTTTTPQVTTTTPEVTTTTTTTTSTTTTSTTTSTTTTSTTTTSTTTSTTTTTTPAPPKRGYGAACTAGDECASGSCKALRDGGSVCACATAGDCPHPERQVCLGNGTCAAACVNGACTGFGCECDLGTCLSDLNPCGQPACPSSNGCPMFEHCTGRVCEGQFVGRCVNVCP